MSVEAKRRIRYFAQSLATLNRALLTVETMPTFTVLVPHFSERIFIDVKSEKNDVDLLKKYHQKEWDNFQEYIKSHSAEDKAREECEWASLRSQTLFRTISGFMNYSEAIKLLYRVKNKKKSDNKIDHRKFKLLIAIQKYEEFEKEVDTLLNRYSNLQIAYIDEQKKNEPEPEFYSVLIDGDCEIENGKRKPRYRIRLPCNPILGD